MTVPEDFLSVDRFDFDLPPELIAQHPIEPRDASRLLIVDRASQQLTDRHFYNLPEYVRPGDVIVLNDTRVLPARLFARRASGGRVELLLLQRKGDGSWRALARPARRLHGGERLTLEGLDGTPTHDNITVLDRDATGVVVRFDDEHAIARHGYVPLPPYIRAPLTDAERYQTVYAQTDGSAAAPTAGLHFTPQLLSKCEAAGATIEYVTLHVGLDTFQPIKTDNARDHDIHTEWLRVSAEVARRIGIAKAEGRRVIAVGTTSVRTLESSAYGFSSSVDVEDIVGATSLYITPGYRFEIVDAMVTNFHLPRTTLMLLVSAFAGEALLKAAYDHAVRHRYRFFSFGDAMLIV